MFAFVDNRPQVLTRIAPGQNPEHVAMRLRFDQHQLVASVSTGTIIRSVGACFLAALLILDPLFTRARLEAAEQPSPEFKPPPNWTQDVKPKEVEDKEKNKEKPVAWCTKAKTDKRGNQVFDDKGWPVSVTDVTYADGTKVHYEHSFIQSVKWVVTLPGGKKITYDPKNKTKTTQEKDKPPVQEEWKEAKEAEQKKESAPGGSPRPEKGSWLSPSYSTSLANVAFPGYSAADPISSNFSPSPLLPAATAERPQSQTPQTQEKPTLNLKPVTYGAPLPDPVIHLDPGPPTKPEDFVQNPSPSGWNPPTDGPGPTRVTPGPQGTPVTPIPGGGINVGSGWASTTVPGSFIADCGGDEADSDATTRERTSTEAGTTTQTKTDSKGEPKPTTTEQVPTGTNPTTQAKIDTKTEPKGTATAPPPQASPDQPTGVCGPDITQQVLAVLKEMRDKYNAADDSKKSSACDALVSISTAEFAWDINEFFTDHGEYPNSKSPDGEPSFLEQLTNSKCCQPRYPCGPTVEFFGKCHNMQVVNYVMWGMTKHLCSSWVNLQQNIAHWARNISSPNKGGQDLMVEVGEKYGKLLESKDKTDPAEFPMLKELVEAHEASSSRAEKICATTCMQKLSPTEKKGVEDRNLHWHWTGLTGAVSGSSTGGR